MTGKIALVGDSPSTIGIDSVRAVLDALGKTTFATELLRAGREFAAADFVSINVFPETGSPVSFGTDGVPGRRYAEMASNQYIKHYYRQDPNLDAMFSSPRNTTTITYLSRDEIPTASYRLSCYDRAHILDRVSVLSCTSLGIPFSVSFYGGFVSGKLGEDGQRRLSDFLPLARSLAAKHIEMARPQLGGWSHALAQVKSRFPDLSPREGEVIAGVLLNMTAADTATKLGIGTTSVITFRKRAYERLGVNDMRELFRIHYSH